MYSQDNDFLQCMVVSWSDVTKMANNSVNVHWVTMFGSFKLRGVYLILGLLDAVFN